MEMKVAIPQAITAELTIAPAETTLFADDGVCEVVK